MLPLMMMFAADKGQTVDAVAALSKIKRFAFGGVGYAGTTSEGEKLFRAILAERDALAKFRTILAKGTAEAKLYALCGIRALDKKALDDAASDLKKQNSVVETIQGCILDKEQSSKVIQRIAGGRYDSYWSKK